MEPVTVVAAALVHEGRVLAARRTWPAAAAGRWELPGGKVEPGERPEDALVREVREELGCDVEVVAWLDGTVPIRQGLVLRAAVVRPVPGADLDLDPVDHDEVRWLAAHELGLGPEEGGVDWLEPDRPFLPAVARHLHA